MDSLFLFISFQTSIFTALIILAIVPPSKTDSLQNEINTWKQRTLKPLFDDRFLQFSAYRISSEGFAVIGLGERSSWESIKSFNCFWKANKGRSIMGRADAMRGLEHSDVRYEVLVYNCKLDRIVNKFGGTLWFGGNGQKAVVYTEGTGESVRSSPPFARNISVCSPPIHGKMSPVLINQWLEFHRRQHSIDHFVFYSVDRTSAELESALKPYVDVGMVEVTALVNDLKYNFWSFGQVLILNDCLYRFRNSSQWVLNLGFDEYLNTKGHDLKAVLEDYKMKSHISFGSFEWSSKLCSLTNKSSEEQQQPGVENIWAIEQMVYKKEVPFCTIKSWREKRICPSYFGHRRWIVNPRKCEVVERHEVKLPKYDGIELSTDLIASEHFKSLLEEDIPNCSDEVTDDKLDESWPWVKSEDMTKMIQNLTKGFESLDSYASRKEVWEAICVASESNR